MAVSTLDVIQALSQIARDAWDGSHHESYSLDGETHKVGLRREEGEPLIDKRVMDGFKIGFSGDKLCIRYHSETTIKEVHDPKFEEKLEEMLSNIASYLVKEYKKYDKSGISLTPDGEMEARVESASKVRTWVMAHRYYKISKMEGVVDAHEKSGPQPFDAKFKKFMELDGKDGKTSKHHRGHYSDSDE